MAKPDAAAELKAAEDKILACVHCGFCLTACPTYTRLGDEADSPRGRIYLMRAVAEGRLSDDDFAFQFHIDQCLGCRACEPVCPSGVQYGYLLERARDTLAKSVGMSLPTRALLFAFGRNTPRAIVSFFSRLFRATGIPRALARKLPSKWNRARFAMAMLATTAPDKRRSPAPQPPPAPEHTKVALLNGCVQQGFFQHINDDTRYVLERNGCTIAPARGQGCCGALHAHAGDLERARELARVNIAAFEQSGAEFIIVNAAGCGAIMKEYGELLHDDAAWAARAHDFSLKVRDVSEFLVTLGPRPRGEIRARVTYDAPCHLLHAQRITHAPTDILKAIPGLELIPLPRADECCGGAGIYGLLHEDLGGRILRDKVEAVHSTGAELLASPNPGCMMQIGGGLLLSESSTRVVHPIELLAQSYRNETA